MTKRIDISVVSPVYMAERIVPELVKQIEKELINVQCEYEIILVDDGSHDKSWHEIKNICNNNAKVKGIKLSKNFGQHYAISACLEYSSGNYVILMDCDLQDDPKYISELFAKAKEGYDIVYTFKIKRNHSLIKNINARIFYKTFNYLTDNQSAEKNVGAYSLLSRKVVNAYISIKDTHRHYLMVLRTLGFKSEYIPIEHSKRFHGKSSYNFSKLYKHALNGITSQSGKLLKLSIGLGFILFFFSIIWALSLVIQYYIKGSEPGYTSLMVFMQLSTGLILISIGITGIYIGKIFEQVKNRPIYIIDEKINF